MRSAHKLGSWAIAAALLGCSTAAPGGGGGGLGFTGGDVAGSGTIFGPGDAVAAADVEATDDASEGDAGHTIGDIDTTASFDAGGDEVDVVDDAANAGDAGEEDLSGTAGDVASDGDVGVEGDAVELGEVIETTDVLDAIGPSDTLDDASDAGGTANDCDPKTQKVYLLTKSYQLLAYAPAEKQINVIGTLNCPAEYATTPFSMAVDRKGVAWVMYSSGELFVVSTTTAQCAKVPFVPGTAGLIECGMGFVADAPGSSDETLFLANPKGQLGTIDTKTFGGKVLGKIGLSPGWPELTGTGLGELWGFFPQTSPATVAQIDKQSGAIVKSQPLTGLSMSGVTNWAFAHWGGRYLMFFQSQKDPSTNVFVYDPADGTYGMYHPSIGYPIVGAGVSICAPTSWLTKPGG